MDSYVSKNGSPLFTRIEKWNQTVSWQNSIEKSEIDNWNEWKIDNDICVSSSVETALAKNH